MFSATNFRLVFASARFLLANIVKCSTFLDFISLTANLRYISLPLQVLTIACIINAFLEGFTHKHTHTYINFISEHRSHFKCIHSAYLSSEITNAKSKSEKKHVKRNKINIKWNKFKRERNEMLKKWDWNGTEMKSRVKQMRRMWKGSWVQRGG